LAEGVPGICFSYLSQQAGGYVSSTNIAYGQDDIPFGCDEFSGYVLARLASGSSTERALLEARQSYLSAHNQLSPAEQKTIAQFVLYGDPAAHPLGPQAGLFGSEGRRARREAIAARANSLAQYIASGERVSPGSPIARGVGSGPGLSAVTSLAAEVGLQGATIVRFAVPQRPAAPTPTARTGKLAVTTPSPVRAYYVALGRAADAKAPAGVTSLVGVEVAERADGTIEQRIFRSRGRLGELMASYFGRVKRVRIAAGSRSERDAVVLETSEDGALVLRRPGAHPFHDPDLEALVGKQLQAEGSVLGRELFLTDFHEV
jgi:hypothetical protein